MNPQAAAPGMNPAAIILFLAFVALTMVVTRWASRRTRTAEDFLAAGHAVSAKQNGMALAGDFVAAAGFLGIAGFVSLSGFDGLIYAIGGVIGWPIMMFLLAEPLRNMGQYTFADVLAFRTGNSSIRVIAALNGLVIVVIYLIMQMVGAGTLVGLLFGLPYAVSVVAIGALMLVYVLFGGMLATTWVQIIKAFLMMLAAFLLLGMSLMAFGFEPTAMLRGAVARGGAGVLAPGRAISGPMEALSVALGLALGVASLPHVLMRFYTVPDARAARRSLFLATSVITLFLLMTFMLGFAAMAIVGPEAIRAADRGGNMALPLLAQAVGGAPLLGFVAAVSFATILAVVAGLVIAGAASLSHDLWSKVIRQGKATPAEQLRVARFASVAICVLAVLLGLAFQGQNIAYLVGLSTAVAASANFPALVLAIFWPRLTAVGAGAGMLMGLLSSILLIVLSPLVQVDMLGHGAAVIELRNPAIVSVPLAFLTTILVSLLTTRSDDRRRYAEMERRILAGEAGS